MSFRVVLDRDVVLLGVLAPGRPEGRLLDLVLSGGLTVLVNDSAIDAYRQTLTRSDLGLPQAAVHQFVDFLAETGTPVAIATPLKPSLSLFADLAIEGHADALVVPDPAGLPRPLARRAAARTAATLLASLPGTSWSG